MHGRGYQGGGTSFGPPVTPDIIKQLLIANLAIFVLSMMVPSVFALGAATPVLRDVPLHSDTEKELLAEALRGAGWNRSRAARRLGIDRTTLWRKIREYGLEPED